jgi:hypothetical protein
MDEGGVQWQFIHQVSIYLFYTPGLSDSDESPGSFPRLSLLTTRCSQHHERHQDQGQARTGSPVPVH